MLHSSEAAQILISGNSGRIETEASKLAKVGSEDEDDDDDDEAVDGHSRGYNGHGKEDDEDNHEKPSHKRARKGTYVVSPTPLMQQLSCEVVNVIQDGSMSVWEKKHWIKMRLMQLEEQQQKGKGDGKNKAREGTKAARKRKNDAACQVEEAGIG
ncbi:hypothetical protein F3Y22_tig00110929pilonHSYRG00053 [Hibiscus syriacus]|uniref:Uncharacterized protein n=1 Tax=Hibiscus syriacus TaxID=106335 RepID=A0A6A2ZDF5_HIBSY|nr:hypothetical protein F3Y22_tig00110929pilonHSYRG00053 [Hibiscus syriacus]